MEIYISLLIGILIFCIVIMLMNEKGINYDKINNRILSLSNNNQNEVFLDEDINKSLSERLLKPFLSSLIKFITKYLPNLGEKNNQNSENLRKQLRQAGITMSVSEYQAIRLVSIGGISLLFFVLGLFSKKDLLWALLMLLFGAYAAFTILRFNLMSRITTRKEKMEHQLPDILDMISVSVEAGLGFEQALLHVINEFKGPLIDELTITYREMSMGRNRKDALNLLGERCGIDDLKSFTGAVIQASRMGISLKNVLKTQAASIRQSRRNKIQEKAAKLSVKILLPMVIFIFPVLFIVLMGPAVINIMEMFGGM